MKTLKCAYCGKEFTQNTYKQIYCTQTCRMRRNEKKKQERRGIYKVTRKGVSELSRLSAEARKHGMNYGQYVGLKGL